METSFVGPSLHLSPGSPSRGTLLAGDDSLEAKNSALKQRSDPIVWPCHEVLLHLELLFTCVYDEIAPPPRRKPIQNISVQPSCV